MASDDTPSLEDLAADLSAETPDVKEEPVVAEPTESESSPEEPTEEATDDGEATEPEAEESETSSEEETEAEPVSKADERKAQLNTEIRDLVTQRRDLQQEVERLNAQVYAPQSIDDIMAETGQSQAEARITAMEQKQELRDYNNQVAEAQLVLSSESERVLNDFPMFNPDSPDYKPAVAEQAAQLLQSNLLVDQNTGQITGSNISPYQLYKTIASANQASAVENQIKGRRATDQEAAAAEPSSSAAPKQAKQDDFLAGLMKGYDTGD